MGDARSEWDRISGLSDEQQEAVSYLREMVTHEVSQVGFLGSVILGSALSIPFGFAVAAIPLVGFVGAGTVAALFIPESPVFRHRVDQRKKRERRTAVREALIDKIQAAGEKLHGRRKDDLMRYGEDHARMMERVKALKKIAASSRSQLSDVDVDRLDEATVDYLRLVYSRLVLWDRLDASRTHEVEEQLETIETQLEKTTYASDKKSLERAKADLERILERRSRLPAQDAATAAQLTAMAETFEDLYHRIQTDPNAGVSDYLSEATERLNIEDELQYAVEDELAELTRKRQARRVSQ
ncbi:MAG: hypothetical protein EP330_16915 [Deltaproteobacteria bacterium]|nr:MAG: hypothetical protein EP330_16915 [Deltaproteobacteria bacterium]